MKKVTVLGDGAWGTAVATVLAHNGHTVMLWCNNIQVAQQIAAKHINEQFLPTVVLSNNIIPTNDLKEALEVSTWIFEAIPVVYMRSVLEKARHYIHADHRLVVLSKGIEQDTLKLPTQIIDDVIGFQVQSTVISGPSFAQEVAEKKLTCVLGATTQETIFFELQALLQNEYFKVNPSVDIRGVQLAGALKNIIALGVGIIEGFTHSQNTKGMFLVRIMQEMVQLFPIFKAANETLYGLAGIGDIVLTAFGNQSRNLEIGILIGNGQKLQDIIQRTHKAPESINTVRSIFQLAIQKKLSLPICTILYELVQGNIEPKKLLEVISS